MAQKTMMYDESIIFSKEYIDLDVKQGVKSPRLDQNETMEIRIDDNILMLSSLFMMLVLRESHVSVTPGTHFFDGNLTKKDKK